MSKNKTQMFAKVKRGWSEAETPTPLHQREKNSLLAGQLFWAKLTRSKLFFYPNKH